ncbi:MAG: DUF1353 domain-containing protein [Nitrospira sp.]|nr:DUF1353 domain-containing protein [Nitrospira sp.]
MKRAPIPTIVHPLYPELRVLLCEQEIRGITIPRGFVWDGASIPGVIRPWMGDPFEGPNRDAGLLHDYLYATCYIPRGQSDELFHRELLADGDAAYEAYLKWAAVRVAGAKHYGAKREWSKFVSEKTLRAWEVQTPIEPLPLFGGP